MAGPTSSTGSTDWLGVHIFYGGDADPLLVGCVAPLVWQLRERGLIDRYFFIRYWIEGPHVRLRLRPAPGVPASAITEQVERHVAPFLAEHPSPDPPAWDAAELRRMFHAEYDESAWPYDGEMPLRANNSYRQASYAPEYERYGGHEGVDLAEWHFEASSDVALWLLATRDITPSSRLGLALRLTLAMCVAFLGNDLSVAAFLERYRDHWSTAYALDTDFPSATDALRRRIRTGFGTAWPDHCRELRRRAAALSLSPDKLLPSYVHMSNNRLGVGIREEAYVADLLCDVLSRTGG